MAKHEKRGRTRRGSGEGARDAAQPNTGLSLAQEAVLGQLLAGVPALAEALRAAAPEGRAAVRAQLAAIEIVDEIVQRAFAVRLGDLRGPQARPAADVAYVLGELAPGREVAREARRARLRLRSAGALPSFELAPASVTAPGASEPADAVAPIPRLAEAHVTRTREEGEVTLALAWQEGSEPDIVRGCMLELDFWQSGVADFTLLGTMSRSRFLRETVGELRSEGQTETRAISWGQARHLVLEALDVHAWRGKELVPEYRRHQALISARLLQVPDTEEARAEIAAEEERAACEGDRPYMADDLDPDELVATWLGAWALGDYAAAFDLLSDDHPLRRELTRDAYVASRRHWADEAQPASLRLTLVREQEQRASALWVPGAAGPLAPGGRRDLEAFWSLVLRESPLGGALAELPFATLSGQVTGRHWYWTGYSVARDRTGGAWRIVQTRDEGATSQALTLEELQKRVQDARAAAEKIIANPPPPSESASAEETLQQLAGALTSAMHYRDALIVRLPLDETLYRASVADAQVLGNYERAAALLERMQGRFPGQARTTFELGVQYYLAGEQIGRQGDAEAQHIWFERATTALRETVESDPTAEHYQALGEVLGRQGHFTQAVTQLRKAIELDPARAMPHADLADIMMSEVGGENLDEPASATPQDEHAREQRILAAGRAALAELREAARLDNNLHGLYTRMGAIYDVLGQPDDALLAFQEAVRHDPGDAEARYTLGTLYLSRGEPERARQELESAAQLSPLTPAIHINLATSYIALARWRDAERELDVVDQIRAGLPQVAELRSRLAQQRKRRSE